MTTRRSAGLSIRMAAACAAVLLGLAGCRGGAPHDSAGEGAQATTYTCPMHQSYVLDRPGDCPICAMKLVPVAPGRGGATPGPTASAAATSYTCPMHQSYVTDRPGDCPICGMDLVPVAPGRGGAGAPASPATGGAPDPAPQKWILASRRQATSHLRLPARVAIDERRIEHVHARVEGIIERVFVEVVGTTVRKGQPLLEMTSPEVLASQREYLAARESLRALPADAPKWMSEDAESLVAAARRRLELWEVPASEIRAMEESGTASRVVTIRAPITGVVTMREALHHSRAVTPEVELYTIVDLSRVFVLAQAFEQDALHVRPGQGAEVSVPGDPSPPQPAQVAFVSPLADAATRTVEVRLELDNPSGRFRPDGVVDVVLHQDLGSQIVVPEQAVVDSGSMQHVFVMGESGSLVPRAVVAGPLVDGGRVIVAGLTEGEHVAASATFLMDSESRLSHALDSLAPPEAMPAPEATPSPQPAAPAPVPHSHGGGAP